MIIVYFHYDDSYKFLKQKNQTDLQLIFRRRI